MGSIDEKIFVKKWKENRETSSAWKKDDFFFLFFWKSFSFLSSYLKWRLNGGWNYSNCQWTVAEELVFRTDDRSVAETVSVWGARGADSHSLANFPYCPCSRQFLLHMCLCLYFVSIIFFFTIFDIRAQHGNRKRKETAVGFESWKFLRVWYRRAFNGNASWYEFDL